MERIRSWALGVDSYVEYLSRVIEGEYAVSTPDLTYYLYLPGRSGGQSAFGGTAASDYLLLGSTAHATKGRVILGTAGANSVTFHEASNITNFGISQTGFSTGGRIGLSSASGRYLDFFSNAAGTSFDGEILTTGGEFAFRSLLSGGMGLLSEDLSDSTVTHGIELRGRSLLTLKTGEDAVVQRIRGGTSQTADLSEWQNFAGTSILLGINASGDLYGGTLGSSTLLLTSNNLAASSTSRLSLLSTSTDITFDNAAAGGYIPFRFGLGLASGTLTGLSAAINVTSTGGNPGTISVSNVGGSNASVLYKAIRIATQTGDMFECLDSNGSTLLSAFNSAGAYRLVSGGAVGSVLTSDANGVGSWSTIAALTASFSDALFSLFDNVTPAKIAQFQLSSLAAGTNVFTLPAIAAGTFAMVNLAQTFTKAQTITPDVDVVGLTINNFTGQTAKLFEIYDQDVGVSPLLQVRTINDASGMPGLHLPTFSFGLTGTFIWASGQVGTGAGITRLNNVGVTAARTFTFPNASGTALIRVVAIDITALATAIAATQIAAAASAPAGVYQVNMYFNCTVAGAGTLLINLLWTDDLGTVDQTIATLDMSATGHVNVTFSFRQTGAANIRYKTTFSTSPVGSGTYRGYIRLQAV